MKINVLYNPDYRRCDIERVLIEKTLFFFYFYNDPRNSPVTLK